MARRIPLTGPWALLVGVACIGIATYQFLTSHTLLEDGIATRGQVVDVDRRYRKGADAFALTVEFVDQEGDSHRERTGYSTSLYGWRVGDPVAIRYNPRDPSEFVVDTWSELWGAPLIFLAIGAVACAAFLCGPRRRAAA